jgi:hypothetical protein
MEHVNKTRLVGGSHGFTMRNKGFLMFPVYFATNRYTATPDFLVDHQNLFCEENFPFWLLLVPLEIQICVGVISMFAGFQKNTHFCVQILHLPTPMNSTRHLLGQL